MKLVLGTAQFGMQYGISNKTGQVTDANLDAIVNSFRSNGNNTFDTARAYGNSEQRISSILVQSDSVTSKIPPNLKKDNYEDWFNQNLFCTLRALDRSSIETLVYHRSADLLSTPKNFLERRVKALKEEGVISKFGVSVYKREELNRVLSHTSVDFVQFPLNLFDRTFLQDDYLHELKSQGLTLEVRSIFLQGLLLMSVSDLPRQFNPWIAKFEEFDTWLSEFKSFTRLDACISFIRSIIEVDRVVFGVQRKEELDQIMKAFKKPKLQLYPDIGSADPRLINPSLWSAGL